MKFKTQETRDKNNVIKLYKGVGGSRQFWPYQLLRLPNPSTLPSPLPSSSRPSSPSPLQLDCIISCDPAFWSLAKAEFIGREVSVDDTAQQSRDAAGTNHLQTTLFRRSAAGSHRPGRRKTEQLPRGTRAAGQKNTSWRERFRRKDNFF